MNASRILTPSQFTALARSLLEDSFPLVEIQGELANLSRPASGHLYFSLKDRNAQIRCAMFRPKSQWLRFKPADGDLVIARGRATLYEARGDFQLVVEHIEQAGEGALQSAIEALKKRLDAEGLFAPERKQALPRWIGRLGVLTSPGGAAIHDVVSVLGRRFPLVEVELLPVPVQGAGAAVQIVEMLARADRSARYDALLLTRGGGSLEDLMAFNDEGLARAIAACATPIACAIGHEIDSSIAEFVADLRAPTPSAAAETLVPDQAELRVRLLRQAEQMGRRLAARLEGAGQRLDHLQLRLRQQHPQTRLARHLKRLADLATRLRHRQATAVALLDQRLRSGRQQLAAQAPGRRIARLELDCRALSTGLQSALARRIERQQLRLSGIARALDAVGPRATLARGYAILQGKDGRVVTSVQGIRAADRLRAVLADGSLTVEVDEVLPAGAAQRDS